MLLLRSALPRDAEQLSCVYFTLQYSLDIESAAIERKKQDARRNLLQPKSLLSLSSQQRR